MSRNRLASLDGLRGFAAVATMVYHAILCWDVSAVGRVLYVPIHAISNPHDLLAKLLLIVFNGEAAVVVFFVLSGAVLAASLEREGGFGPRIAVSFVIRRLLRIYPVLVVCVVGYFLIINALNLTFPDIYKRSFTHDDLIRNALLTAITMHGATWTLQVEVLAVPFILAAFAMSRLWDATGLVFALAYAALAYDNSWITFGLPLIHAVLFSFALGFIVPCRGMQTFAAQFGRHAWIGFAAGLLLARHVVPHASVASAFVQGMFAFLLVAALYHAPASPRVLTSPAALALGRISYSFYLWNVPVMNVLIPPLLILVGAGASARFLELGALLSVATFVVTLPLAHWSERYIERPPIRLSRRLLQPRTGGALVGVPAVPQSVG